MSEWFAKVKEALSRVKRKELIIVAVLIVMLLAVYFWGGGNLFSNLELMMPAVIHESGYQEELIDLLITFLNESQYYIFTVFLTSLPYSQAIAQRLYKDSERRISESGFGCRSLSRKYFYRNKARHKIFYKHLVKIGYGRYCYLQLLTCSYK